MARVEKTEARFMNFEHQTGCMIHQDSVQRTDSMDLPWVPMFKEYEERHGSRKIAIQSSCSICCPWSDGIKVREQ